MSFLCYKRNVEFGDIATIYINFKCVYVQKIEEGKVFQTKFGALKHNDLIGKEYGTKIDLKNGWIYLLHITPELWTETLPHRTQILYATDISLITSLLYLRPGSVVVEAGTGSGSLSHSILRTIAPNGHLYTFDFHEERVKKALEEFNDHGLSGLVSISARDVCQNGFDLTNIADAVFLDLPHPWEAIPFAAQAMKSKGSRICCFSPCIEQVQKTCVALREHHFEDIETIECVLKPFAIRKLALTRLPLLDCDKLPVSEDDCFAENEETKKEGQQIDCLSSKKCKTVIESKEYVVPLPVIQVAGHTGFLTFATNVF